MNFLFLAIFLAGLIIGSFLNVLIYRSSIDESALKGRSKCPKCHKLIAWYDNIPLLSYLILRGKCRKCTEKISIVYPLVELTTGVIFLGWWLYWQDYIFSHALRENIAVPVFWLVIACLYLVILMVDLMSYIIPDFASLGLIGLGLGYGIYRVLEAQISGRDFFYTILAAVGMALAFAGLIVGTRGKGMGWGDVKLVLGLGLVLGFPLILVNVFLAFVIGAVVGIGLIMTKRKALGQVLPFGPFLILGAVIAAFYGQMIWNWYFGLL